MAFAGSRWATAWIVVVLNAAAAAEALVPPAPRCRPIAADLWRAIESGRPCVGGELPSEHELCEMYGVSRSTVREAFRRLQLRGLVSPQQGAVSRVIATEMRGCTVVLGSAEVTREYAEGNSVDFRPHRGALSDRRVQELALPDPDQSIAARGCAGSGVPGCRSR
ncbi:MAG: GntR family transcriptional regulator [Pseudonocardia sp.]|uniref:GntR family transcriptional regulator n=1 Tax=unclassified Pseudonocardia TaxID=2619320 RepID=UPI001ACBE8E4|nr:MULTISPECIES: GntR family transcriptional regulator [unclassified Pseudonocardia]MBN9112219.1 GntR family transcriptional regulator [Pseudonocardia sp.]